MVLARLALPSPATIGITLALTVGAAHAAALPDPSAARAKIAPWVMEHATATAPAEFIVVLADQADLSAADQFPDRTSRTRFVRDALYAKAKESQAPLLAWLDQHAIEYRPFYIVNAVLVTGTIDVADALAARADVTRIDGNPEIRQDSPVRALPGELAAATRAAETAQGIEPGILSVRAPEVWASGVSGQGIVIGCADTGVNWDHAALKGKYRGWDGAEAHHDYNWHDSIHSGTGLGGVCGADTRAPCDDNGHGTLTIAIAVGGDSSGANRVGVAPGARFIACRNMSEGSGSPARYIECMEWFLAPYPIGGTPAQGDPTMAPDLTTNSWGCPASEGCHPASLQAAVEAQRAAGIMFVAGAGNDGPLCSTVTDPPAIYDAAYTVGAYSSVTGSLAPFSSRGPVTNDGSGRMKPDLTAPGVAVRSALPGGYGTFSGTSLATPHVAGAIALLWSACPSLRRQIAATENVLDRTASPVFSADCDAGAIPNNNWGWGRLDVKAAVDLGPLGPALIPPQGAEPGGVFLASAFPNPAHHSTVVRFRLARPGTYDLAIFSSSGQRIRTLERGASPTGERIVRWDGRLAGGAAAGPAVYFLRLASAGAEVTKKLIWLGQ